MNRTDFQQLAEVRIEEAGILLANKKWDGAYYLAGYAVECALKACIAKRTNQYDFPDKKLVERSFTHDLARLVDCANLLAQRQADMSTDPGLLDNWDIVEVWTEASRYERKTQDQAETLYNATTHGVLPWLKRHW
jgi:HEPN domain-containing protein